MPTRPPSTATRQTWPPNYTDVFRWRQDQLIAFRRDPRIVEGARRFYAEHPAAFINHWCLTYDPRNAGTGTPTRLPFILFERQDEFVGFLLALVRAQESGLVEKARDIGATWLCCAFSIWLWLFWPGAAIGWGSRKEQLVDRIGDPDSIFEKMRILVLGLPRQFWPRGFEPGEHMTFMKIVNPETGATITGEAGDNIGRGGRKLIYFKDESAHYTHPEKIEAALSDTTRVQVDISSVNGLGNVFHRRREAGVEWRPGMPIASGRISVFVMDWRDHPAKTQEWYDTRRRRFADDGLLHVFAQEIDRNYAASVDGVIIPAEWVKAAIDAHIRLGFDDSGGWIAALDVADDGADLNALAVRKGAVLTSVEHWGERDTGRTARRALERCAGLGRVELQYDCIGVGAGIKAETNRLTDEALMPAGIRIVPWSAAAAALDPDEPIEPTRPGQPPSPLNKDFYGNLKAQAWWQTRRRFERTWRAVNEPTFTWRPEDLISLPSDLPMLRQVEKELSQPTARKDGRMRLIVDKMPDGTRSPNLADAIVMAFWPVPSPQPLVVPDEALRRARGHQVRRRFA